MTYRIHRIAALCVLSMLATGSRVFAQVPDAPPDAAQQDASARREASVRFRRGVQLFDEGNYEAALIEFQRTYDAAPSYRVLFNIGQCHLAMQHYLEALSAYERYLEVGGDQVPADRREMLRRQVADLRERTGTLEISTDVDGVEITIDDQPRGTTPLAEPVPLDIGRHRVEARAQGYETMTRSITIAGGEHAELDLELEPLPTITIETSSADDNRRMRRVGHIGLVATGVLAVGATITGGLTLGANRDLEREVATFPGDPDDISGARGRTQALSLTTDIVGGTALALGTTSLVLLLADARRHRAPDEPSVAVGANRRGIFVGGRF
jgi:hypothetical protein